MGLVIQLNPITLPPKASTFGNPSGAMGGFQNDLLKSTLMPDYYTLVKAGVVFFGFATSANTQFSGGAGGSPFIGIYNPPSSGKDFVILQTRVAVRTTGTAAVNYDVAWWTGVSALPTGTRTNPTNMYSQQNSGSSAAMFVATAMTGSTALTNQISVLSGGLTAATAVTNVQQAMENTNGAIVLSPGILGAIGQPAALTAASFDVTVIWAEVGA